MPRTVMLSPSWSLPASTTFEPVTVTSSCTPFRQSELRVELPMRRPRESGLITTVIVKGATFECLEKNVPDHVPRISIADGCVEPTADVACLLWAPAGPVITNNEKNRTWHEKVLLVIVI